MLKIWKTKPASIADMNDEECLAKFIEFLEERVSVTTGFIQDRETGNITHQVIQVQCGEFVSVSAPEPLEVTLRVATAEENGQLLN